MLYNLLKNKISYLYYVITCADVRDSYKFPLQSKFPNYTPKAIKKKKNPMKSMKPLKSRVIKNLSMQEQVLPSKDISKKITRRSREKREGGEKPRGRAPKSEAEEKKNLRRGKGKDAAAES